MMKDFFLRGIEPLAKTVEEFPWEDPVAYRWFLAQTYYYVCHSTRLLALSAARFSVDRDALHKRFVEHIKEEKNHERLALNDLKHLDGNIGAYPELPVTRTFYEPQYYKIEYEAPTALLGYILSLEGISVRKMGQVYSILTQTYGEKGATFIKLHAGEDIEHVEKAYEQLAELDQKEISFVKQNFLQSCDVYGRLLVTCAEFRRN